jgi:hypothetical protein
MQVQFIKKLLINKSVKLKFAKPYLEKNAMHTTLFSQSTAFIIIQKIEREVQKKRPFERKRNFRERWHWGLLSQ